MLILKADKLPTPVSTLEWDRHSPRIPRLAAGSFELCVFTVCFPPPFSSFCHSLFCSYLTLFLTYTCVHACTKTHSVVWLRTLPRTVFLKETSAPAKTDIWPIFSSWLWSIAPPPATPYPSFSPSPPLSRSFSLSEISRSRALCETERTPSHTRWLSAAVCACVSGTARGGQAWIASLASSSRSGGPGDARAKSTVRKRIIMRVMRTCITMLPSTCTVSDPASWLGWEGEGGVV